MSDIAQMLHEMEIVSQMPEAEAAKDSDDCQIIAQNQIHSSTASISANVPTEFEQVAPIEVNSGVEYAKGKRKLTSEVWNSMKKVKIEGKDVAICNLCNAHIGASSKSGTTALKNHLKSCKRRHNQGIEEAIGRQKQISIEKQNDNIRLKNWTFDYEYSRNQLARAIILHEYPLSIVEHHGFQQFVRSLQPFFKMVSRNTMKKDIMKVYVIEREKLRFCIGRNSSRIAVTTDMWTSNQKKGYMSITAHYIDENWILRSLILRFVYVPAPHTTENLAQYLIDGLIAWNLETKLSTITVDNCSTNDNMIREVVVKLSSSCLLQGKLVHMRCAAHILNLVVKEGLSCIDIAIETIRNSVAFWSATPSRVEKFEDMAKQLNISCTKKLFLDCKTRWNSTYLMLQTAFIYEDVFLRMKVRDRHYTCVPSADDWDVAKKICEKLELFYGITEFFSGRKYPTSNTYFVKICEIRESLTTWIDSCDEIIVPMAQKMYSKFEKYFSDVHIVMGVSQMLDPRYKLMALDFYFPQIYGVRADIEKSRVRDTCYDLLKEYQTRAKTGKSSTPNLNTSTSSSSTKATTKLINFLNSSVSDIHVKSELDHYLEESILPWCDEFDILNWWKTNGIKYPTLQNIARDFLAIPVSTVASESAFSTGGRVVSLHRSRLHPDTLEALMCSQSWLWHEIEGFHVPPTEMQMNSMEDDIGDIAAGLSSSSK